MTKKLRFCLLLIFVVAVYATHLSAHSGGLSYYFNTARIPEYDNNVYYVGNEDIGWSLDESAHTNGTAVTYKFETGYYELSDTYKALVAQAAAKWSGVVTITESDNGVGTIERINNTLGVPAVLHSYYTDTNGHFTSWKMQINTAYEDDYTSDQIAVFIAHEFGHAIGLNDLYDSQNYNKLMCGEADYITATAPTYQDQWGARLITGQHTTHRWTCTAANHYCTICEGVGTHSPSRGTSYTSNNSSGHTVYCSACNYTFTESHSAYYDQTAGECTACGYTGSIQLSVGDDIE